MKTIRITFKSGPYKGSERDSPRSAGQKMGGRTSTFPSSLTKVQGSGKVLI